MNSTKLFTDYVNSRAKKEIDRKKLISYVDVARETGLSDVMVRNMIQGKIKSPSLNMLKKLCDWMGTDVGDYG